jgi:hypothetical protein
VTYRKKNHHPFGTCHHLAPSSARLFQFHNGRISLWLDRPPVSGQPRNTAYRAPNISRRFDLELPGKESGRKGVETALQANGPKNSL